MSMQKWFVSRQSYWGVEPEDRYMVEIAYGGRDYANCDMLAPKYSGEGEEYNDPLEAVEAAISIREQWQKDSPELIINIAMGFTGGDTMPFSPSTVEGLRKWGTERKEELDRDGYACGTCGRIVNLSSYYTDDQDEKFCSEYCFEKGTEDEF